VPHNPLATPGDATARFIAVELPELFGLTGATSYANELLAVTAVGGTAIALRLDWRGEFEDPMAAGAFRADRVPPFSDCGVRLTGRTVLEIPFDHCDLTRLVFEFSQYDRRLQSYPCVRRTLFVGGLHRQSLSDRAVGVPVECQAEVTSAHLHASRVIGDT
jgi:hypothetical protein